MFFVEGLDCHLISVSQLAKDNGCIVQMSDRICVVQDRITQTLIGAGKELNGYYFFCGVAAAGMTQVQAILAMEVWHCRFGHPASTAMEMMCVPDSSSSMSFDSKSCSICIRAKKCRDSFPISINKVQRFLS